IKISSRKRWKLWKATKKLALCRQKYIKPKTAGRRTSLTRPVLRFLSRGGWLIAGTGKKTPDNTTKREKCFPTKVRCLSGEEERWKRVRYSAKRTMKIISGTPTI